MLSILLLTGCSSGLLFGQSSGFVGALGGISTLSADGQTRITPDSTQVSLYKPENGPTFMAVGGGHLSDYLSLQGSYGWNRNDLTLTSSQSCADANMFVEQVRVATQHSVLGELLLYFRNRKSSVRPYLSAGAGVVRLSSPEASIRSARGLNQMAPGAFGSTSAAFRVAVGIDLFIKNGWAFRFTFSETIRNNAISEQLSPPGERNLAHFQNLFGFVKHF